MLENHILEVGVFPVGKVGVAIGKLAIGGVFLAEGLELQRMAGKSPVFERGDMVGLH